MQVLVLNTWGNFSKGDIIDLPDSTAAACIVHKVVKANDGKPAEESKKKK